MTRRGESPPERHRLGALAAALVGLWPLARRMARRLLAALAPPPGRHDRGEGMEVNDQKARSRGSTRRGRRAGRPTRIPPSGWKDILLRVKDEIARDKVAIVSAGLAYYAMLSVFPALIALVSLYGLLADPVDVQSQMSEVGGLVPSAARQLLLEQLGSIASSSSAGLSIGFAVSVGAALWSASSGTTQLIESINIAYDEKETRGFFKLRGLALLFTLALIGFVIIALGAVAVMPGLFGRLGIGPVGEALLRWGRWPVLAISVMFGLALLYRYAPARDRPRWRWVSVGAITATTLWLAASAGFSWYATNFGKFNETYGALGAVVVLLLWFFISSFVVLLGAELDAEMEHQTARDSTVGPEEPMGERGAVKADTLGRTMGGNGRPRSPPAPPEARP